MHHALWKQITRFGADERGAVTVDFVVLTAAIVALCLGITIPILDSTTGVGERIATMIGQTP